MRELKFTEEEKKYIKETLNVVLDDIHKIYEITPQENIFIEVEIDNEYKYLLCIGPKAIALLTLETDKEEWKKLFINGDANFSYKTNVLLEREITVESGSRKNKKEEQYKRRNDLEDNFDLEIIARLLADYENIRNRIISHIETCHSQKNEIMSKLQRIRTIYSSDVYVDLGQATTLNMQKIELEEKDGKKIGTIDFGNRLVKIITEGDIVLTQIEPVKQKIKQ